MKENIKLLITEVESLTNDFNLKDKATKPVTKEIALTLLSKLKRSQDDPINESFNDIIEEQISTVITVVGQIN